jgi:zinc-ribbon domain
MPPPAASCENCGSKVSKRAKFCPECGTRLGTWVGESEGVDRSFQTGTRAKPASAVGGADKRRLGRDGDATAELPVPPEETGPVPVEVTSVQPRWFGVTPPMLLFGLAAAALALAVVFLVTGHWIPGGLCLAAAALLVAAFAEVARRKPDTAAARASAEALGTLRARAGYAVESLSVRQRVARQVALRRQELLHLEAERSVRLGDLGEAVYGGDDEGTERLRSEIAALDERAAALEDEVLEVAPTEMVEVPEPPEPPAPGPVPEPAPTPVPEPYPQPVPEPYPPPDEVTPPEPARVPEPGPLDRASGRRTGAS